MKGKVKWFDEMKGFGFIVQESGQDIFFGSREIEEGSVNPGDEVEFEPKEGSKGTYATCVRLV